MGHQIYMQVISLTRLSHNCSWRFYKYGIKRRLIEAAKVLKCSQKLDIVTWKKVDHKYSWHLCILYTSHCKLGEWKSKVCVCLEHVVDVWAIVVLLISSSWFLFCRLGYCVKFISWLFKANFSLRYNNLMFWFLSWNNLIVLLQIELPLLCSSTRSSLMLEGCLKVRV